MKRLKNSDFSVIVDLDTAQSEYEFRYLTDQDMWENDSVADKYIPNGIDSDNSVVSSNIKVMGRDIVETNLEQSDDYPKGGFSLGINKTYKKVGGVI